MKTKSSIFAVALLAAVLVVSPRVYADDSTSTLTKDKTTTTGTHTQGSYNDTSHTQTDADQTKAAEKSKNGPGT